MFAAHRGNLVQVQAWIEDGRVDIDAQDILEQTALSKASMEGHLPLVEWLLEKGAEPNTGRPLHGASRNGHLPVVKHLLENAAKVNITDPRHYLYTPLHEATSKGHLAIVKHLMMQGADLDAADRWNRTPVDLARRRVNTVQANDQEKMQNSIAVCDYLESMMKLRQCHALVIHLLSMDLYARPHGRPLDGEENADSSVSA